MAIVNTHYGFCAKGGAAPKLAGTWVLNERLYAPAQGISERVNFTAKGMSGTANSVSIDYGINRNLSYIYATSGSYQVYNFSTNVWNNKYKAWTFPTDATASDEFLAWLASNATKQ